MIKKNNLKIKEIYLKKIKILKKYNEAYFNKSRPIVDDSVYDDLKKEILQLETNHPFLIKCRFSQSANVGFKPSKNFKK